jgi:nitrogen fixation-related uncharacterized protein
MGSPVYGCLCQNPKEVGYRMGEATIALLAMTVLIFAIFVGFFIWGIKTGQFKNVEDPKYKMMADEKQVKDEEKEAHDDE